MSERALELRVGLVLLAAFAILGAFVLLLGDFHLDRGRAVNVDFNFSGAIQKGAPVKISGIKVGRVEEVKFMGGQLNDRGESIQIRLVLSIEERTRPVLRQNTEFFVSTQGLLGENYVEIVPHPGESPLLAEGATVRGVDPARLDLLLARAYDFLASVSDLMHSNRGIFEDFVRSSASLVGALDKAVQHGQVDLSVTLKNVASATEHAAHVLAALDGAVGDGRRLGGTLDDAAATVAEIRRDVPPLMARMQAVLEDLVRLEEALGDVDRTRVRALIDRTTSALKSANEMLDDAKAVSRRLRTGQGTVGLLLQDDEIYDDLKELLRDLKQHPWKLIWKD